jgi:hypothetical protein
VVPVRARGPGGASHHRTAALLPAAAVDVRDLRDLDRLYLDLPRDDGVDWDEIAAILGEAYCLVAPRQLLAQLDRGEPPLGRGR